MDAEIDLSTNAVRSFRAQTGTLPVEVGPRAEGKYGCLNSARNKDDNYIHVPLCTSRMIAPPSLRDQLSFLHLSATFSSSNSAASLQNRHVIFEHENVSALSWKKLQFTYHRSFSEMAGTKKRYVVGFISRSQMTRIQRGRGAKSQRLTRRFE